MSASAQTYNEYDNMLLIITGFAITLHVGSPQSQIVPQQLHDERRILVGLLGQGVQLGDGIVKGLLGQVAGAVRRVEDLVVEHREV